MSKKIALRLLAIPAAVAASTPAMAEVPAAVTTAITTAGTDLNTVGVAIIAAMAAFWGIKAIGTKLGLWK